MPLSDPDVSYAIPLSKAELCARYLLEADHTPCMQYRSSLGLTGTGDVTQEVREVMTQVMQDQLTKNGDTMDSLDVNTRLVLIV